jgi:hypothetical protein
MHPLVFLLFSGVAVVVCSVSPIVWVDTGSAISGVSVTSQHSNDYAVSLVDPNVEYNKLVIELTSNENLQVQGGMVSIFMHNVRAGLWCLYERGCQPYS